MKYLVNSVRVFSLLTIVLIIPSMFAFVSNAHAQSLPDLNGKWTRKPVDGGVSNVALSIFQSGAAFTLKVDGKDISGSIKGNSFLVNGFDEVGIIEQNGNLVRWPGGDTWVKTVAPAHSPVTPKQTGSGPLPGPTSPWPKIVEEDPAFTRKTPEQRCVEAVQGKIAWNKAGTTTWGAGNVAALCQGTTNPDATILCFKYEIQMHDDWARAIKTCKAAKPVASGVVDLNGKWTYYAADGTAFRNAAVIAQSGASLRFDNGDGSGSQGDIKGTTVSAWGWRLNGTLSTDGRTIDWSNGTKWVKQ